MNPQASGHLKQQQTRERLRDAAMTLFAERGFDAVTVTDIAAQAGVGRATFFRHFPDKAEVLFEDDDAEHLLLAKAIAGAARPMAPLGGSLANALRAMHAGCLVLADSKAVQAVRHPMREQLIAAHPQLQACTLVKERAYTDAAEQALIEQGADRMTARLAAHIANACYGLAYNETFDTPAHLPAAVDRAFLRLSELKDW